MKQLPFIGLFFICGYSSYAQTSERNDSLDLEALNTQAYNLYLTHSDSSIQLGNVALKRATQTEDILQQGRAYLALAKAHWAKANFMLATDYGFKALKIFNGAGKPDYLVLTYLGLGRTLTELGNYAKAKQFIKQAITIARQERDSTLLADGFREYSFLYTEEKKYDSAIYFADLGIAFFLHQNNLLDVSILYGRKSRVYYELKDFDKSREFAYKGIPLDSLTGNQRALSISKFLAAQSEYQFGNRKKAISLVKGSLQISEKINNQQWLIKGHELLATLYKEEGNLAKAIEHLELVNNFKDSFFNIEKSGQAQEMQALYELDSKEKTIQLLEKENKLKQQQFTNQKLYVIILVISVALLIAIIFFLNRLRIFQKNANQRLSEQKEEVKKQAQTLHELNELKTKLFSVISHDLRGPISSLRALLGLLANKSMTSEEFIFISEKLKSNIDSTHQTLDNLLNWCLAQMEGIKTTAKKVSLSSAIDEVCVLLQDVAVAKGITYKKDFDLHSTALVDANQLQVILRNIIHNAIKFSKTESTIHISITSSGTFWKITVADFGIGMNKEEINTILHTRDHFSKIGTQQEKGTGLGLMLTKEFIALNAGQFQIESEVNKGTSISVYLPKAS